eukprot:XP_006579329.2 uncharacterized protein LOC102659705 [Glycine max]
MTEFGSVDERNTGARRPQQKITLFNCYSLTHPLHDQKIQITLSDANSFLLRIWLLQECLLQPSPWLNEVESAGDGSDAPQGGGFDVGGLETDPRW